ncbi:MAG: hypothetical protein K9N05_02515 [Candidatus Marinimicrobia bacterium]|nr:hypothetical protein [Candidatus Neomarinimicrobiota bacterium]
MSKKQCLVVLSLITIIVQIQARPIQFNGAILLGGKIPESEIVSSFYNKNILVQGGVELEALYKRVGVYVKANKVINNTLFDQTLYQKLTKGWWYSFGIIKKFGLPSIYIDTKIGFVHYPMFFTGNNQEGFAFDVAVGVGKHLSEKISLSIVADYNHNSMVDNMWYSEYHELTPTFSNGGLSVSMGFNFVLL